MRPSYKKQGRRDDAAALFTIPAINLFGLRRSRGVGLGGRCMLFFLARVFVAQIHIGARFHQNEYGQRCEQNKSNQNFNHFVFLPV
jgi:hypothetical protein